MHIAAVNYLYCDYAFGPATAPYDVEPPGVCHCGGWLVTNQPRCKNSSYRPYLVATSRGSRSERRTLTTPASQSTSSTASQGR